MKLKHYWPIGVLVAYVAFMSGMLLTGRISTAGMIPSAGHPYVDAHGRAVAVHMNVRDAQGRLVPVQYGDGVWGAGGGGGGGSAGGTGGTGGTGAAGTAGASGAPGPTPTPLDVTFRASVVGGSCANSGTASVTCTHAVTGDLLLMIAGDCSSTSTQTCPAGTSTVISDSTGGTTVTVCSRTATSNDSSTAYKITSSAHQLTEGCLDMYSPSAQTVAVAASAAAACVVPSATYFTAPLVTASAPPYVDLGIMGAQAVSVLPPLTGFSLMQGAITALGAQWTPAATGLGEPLMWNSGSASSTECLSLLISG